MHIFISTDHPLSYWIWTISTCQWCCTIKCPKVYILILKSCFKEKIHIMFQYMWCSDVMWLVRHLSGNVNNSDSVVSCFRCICNYGMVLWRSFRLAWLLQHRFYVQDEQNAAKQRTFYDIYSEAIVSLWLFKEVLVYRWINFSFYLQPSQFESKVQEVVQLVKESVLLGEQREAPLLENSNTQRELSALVQGLLLNFSKVNWCVSYIEAQIKK